MRGIRRKAARTAFSLGMTAILVLLSGCGSSRKGQAVSINSSTGEIVVPTIVTGSETGTGTGFGVESIVQTEEDEIVFTLSSNSSTGFSWYQTSTNDVLVETENRTEDHPAEKVSGGSDSSVSDSVSGTSQMTMVGQPDQTVLTFKAVEKGTARLVYTYGQNWSGGEKTQKVTITVDVNQGDKGQLVIDRHSIALTYENI